jgi:hypothetical protein
MYMLHSHDILNLMWQNVSRLYSGLSDTEKMQRYVNEEKNIREENLRLQRKLQLEVERREALCRHLSESESRWHLCLIVWPVLWAPFACFV